MAHSSDSEGQTKYRIRSLGYGGLGFYWAWIYYVFFHDALYQLFAQPQTIALVTQSVSFSAYVAIMLLAALRRQPATLLSRPVLNYAAPVAASVGTLLIVGSSQLVPSLGLGLLILGALMTGLGTGHLLLTWGFLFIASDPKLISSRIAFSLLFSLLVFLILTILPAPLDSLLCIALPSLSLGSYLVAKYSARQNEAEPTKQHSSVTVLPRKLGLALAGAGLVFGWCLGLSMTAEVGFQSLVMVVVNSLLAITVFLYYRLTGKNFGFSSGFLVILPIVGLALLLVALSPASNLLPVFFLVRLGYSLFDIIIWLQMPRVFTQIHSFRIFAFSRLTLDGGALLGVLIVHLLSALQILHSSLPLQIIIVGSLAFINLGFTLNKHDFESSWNLLPILRSEVRDFDVALRAVAEIYALSGREVEIMAMIARGRSATYVHAHLGIALSTVQTHTKNGYRKLGVHSRQELLSLIEKHMDQS